MRSTGRRATFSSRDLEWRRSSIASGPDTVGAAITEAGFDRPVMVGHSIGAGIATAYAARNPTSGVVNVDASPPIDGYWAEMLDDPDFVVDVTRIAMAAVRRERLPYLIVTGSHPAAESARWMHTNLPRARFEVLAPSGHFPHLGFPARFAACLRATATWPLDAGR